MHQRLRNVACGQATDASAQALLVTAPNSTPRCESSVHFRGRGSAGFAAGGGRSMPGAQVTKPLENMIGDFEMKMMNNLLLGSAAGFVAITGAQAADLPVKAKPVEYVKICSLYGVGFYYIPGTDMCLTIGGYARPA